MAQTPDKPDRLLRIRDVADLLACSVRTLERLIAAGEFPAPCRWAGRRMYAESVITSQIERIKRGASCRQ